MICTQACPNANPAFSTSIFPISGPAPVHSPRELYLRALEQEHEEILYEAYNQRKNIAMSSPGASSSKGETYMSAIDLAAYSGIDWSADAHYDERGRQLDFKETVRQRQARLEFLRRQEFARRLALKGLNNSAASAYAIKRLPPPRARPAERVNAAIKIQRVYRAHLAVRCALGELEHLHEHLQSMRSAFSPKLAFLASPLSSPSSSPRWKSKQLDNALTIREYSDALHLILLELASFGRSLKAASPKTAEHPRVVAATRLLSDDLRTEMERLDRAKVDVWVKDQRDHQNDVRVDVLEAIEESDSEGEADMDIDTDDEDVPSLASDVSGESESESEQEQDDEDDDAVTGTQAAALAAIFAAATERRARKAGVKAGLGHRRTSSVSSMSSISSALSLNLQLSSSSSSTGSSISSRHSRASRRPSLGSISEVDEA